MGTGEFLDHGGPMVIWDEGSAGRRLGTEINASFCGSPKCRWAHVEAELVEDERRQSASDAGTSVLGATCRCTIHIDSGEIRVERSSGAAPAVVQLVSRLEELITNGEGALRPLLRKRWRRATGTAQDAWLTHDWTWWTPGAMVPWREVFPDDPHYLFSSQGYEFLADDTYCIAENCNCHEVVIDLHLFQDESTDRLYSITLDLDRWSIRRIRSASASANAPTDWPQDLWKQLQDRWPELRKELTERRRKLRRIAPDIRRLAGTAKEPVTREAERPGRNAPCHCGSGKKYKKCCLANDVRPV